MSIFDPPPQAKSGSIFDPPPASATAPPPPASPGSSDTPASFNQPDSLGQMSAFDPRAAKSTWNDYLMAHLAEAGKGIGQIGQSADDMVRHATNVFGLGDRVAAGMSNLTGVGGGDLAAQQAQTAAADARLPPEAKLAASMTGFAPVGRLGMAKGIAADLAPAGSGFVRGALANATGSAAEGASANYLAALGHGASPDDAAKQGLWGAVVGAPVGALSELGGRMFAPAGPKPPEVGAPAGTDVTGVPRAPTGMYAAKETGYAPLDSLYFDTHGDAINRAQAAIRQVRDPQGKGVPLGIPSEVNSILTDTNGLANPEVTGRTIQQASRDLRATGDWTGHRYADALDNTLRYDAPSAGGEAGEAWDAKQAGDLWYQRINDLERLDEPTAANVKQTQGFYSDPQSPEAQSLARLQSAMKSGFNPWHLRHAIGPVIGGGMGAVEDYLNPEDHHNPWLNIGSRAGEGMLLFSGLPWLARARPQSAINATRYTIGTGQPYIPPSNAGPLGDRLRAIIFGNMAGGQRP